MKKFNYNKKEENLIEVPVVEIPIDEFGNELSVEVSDAPIVKNSKTTPVVKNDKTIEKLLAAANASEELVSKSLFTREKGMFNLSKIKKYCTNKFKKVAFLAALLDNFHPEKDNVYRFIDKLCHEFSGKRLNFSLFENNYLETFLNDIQYDKVYQIYVQYGRNRFYITRYYDEEINKEDYE